MGLASLWRKVNQRDRLENIAGVITASGFLACTVFFAIAKLWVTSLASLFLVGCIAFILFKLRNARRQIPTPDPEAPVLPFLLAEREALQAQADLLSTTFIWYWGPLGVGVIIFFTSIRGFDSMALAYAAVVVAMGFGVEALNRAAVRKQIKPALAWINEQIAHLENDQ
jgi:hypothetical protein